METAIEQEETQDTTDYLAMAREAFTASTTYFDSSIRAKIESNLRQFQGVHPAGSKYHSDAYRGRSKLYRPKTRSTIRKNEAIAAEALFSAKDVLSISAQDDSDEIQQASAAVVMELINYRLKKSVPWFLISMGAYQDAQALGACLSYQYWDYDAERGVDKPCIELIPLENFRLDPAAEWSDPINTSPYLIQLIPMYVKDVKARMRRTPIKSEGTRAWKTMTDAQILQASKLYSDSTRLTRERGRTDSKEVSQSVGDFTVVWVHRNIIAVDGQDLLFYTLGTFHMLTDPEPLKAAYWHGRRPYAMGFCMIETHKVYPEGVADVTKSLASEINEVANQRIDNVKFAMNKRYFVKRNKQVDVRSLTRNTPSSVTMMDDPEKDVLVINTPDVTASAYQEQDRLNVDFDEVAGTFSPSSVQSNRKLNETVGGMNILTGNASQVSSYQLRTFVETWVEPVLSQMILLEQHYETDSVVLALAGKKAKLFQRFGVDAVTDDLLSRELTLNVNVGIGATSPQEQIANFMLGMKNLKELLADGVLEKYGLDIGEVIKELFGKLGYKDGDRFFDETQDPALLAAQAEIQELQKALEQKVSPEMLAKQIEKLDAEIANIGTKSKDNIATQVEKSMRSIFAAMQAAQVVAATPQVSPIADELMKAAGYVPPNPAAIDPNFPQPMADATGMTLQPMFNPKTSIETAQATGDTTPLTPALPAAPASPGVGANQGIQTVRPDSNG